MRRLGGQGLQKFLKERIWICQGQRHGMHLLWTGGAHVSSMQYALISYDLQLILALMPHALLPQAGTSLVPLYSVSSGAYGRRSMTPGEEGGRTIRPRQGTKRLDRG